MAKSLTKSRLLMLLVVLELGGGCGDEGGSSGSPTTGGEPETIGGTAGTSVPSMGGGNTGGHEASSGATGGAGSGATPAAAGGAASGGLGTGAAATGAVTAGGTVTGGAAPGGAVIGGATTGGTVTGGIAMGGMMTGGVTTGGTGTGGVATGGTATGGAASAGTMIGGATTGGAPPGCDPGTTETQWATDCPTAPYAHCVSGSWVAPGAETGAPLRLETAHFALYWPDGTNLNVADGESAAETLETIWDTYFGSPMFFPEPYCNSATKYKAAVHFDNDFPLWGGGWGNGYMGMWIGPGAARDHWGLAHEFMHGVQSTTSGLRRSGGQDYDGWLYESHANFSPHQLAEYHDDVHCSEMSINAPHLYLGSTRDRYCNWQFMEYLKDRYCYRAVNDIWTASPASNDPFVNIRETRGWSQSELNDFLGDWAMHNVTFDYQESAAAMRSTYGPITNTSRPERRLRVTRLEALDDSFADNRRFVSPYYWAPQRFGYNVVRLFPEVGAKEVTVTFRGVTQSGTSSDWRWGFVATDTNLTTARYGALQQGADGQATFCMGADEMLWLVVMATPAQHQQIYWDQFYDTIYRYPYMVQVDGAWPEGFRDGARDACPSGTTRHSNGRGCAPASTPSSVFVGPHAQVLGGTVSGDARIEDQAMVLSGTVSGGTVGALTVVERFAVSDSAVVQTTFYPPSVFEGTAATGSVRLLGDIEYRANRTSGSFTGFVDATTSPRSIDEVTMPPPYSWRP